ncbi:hypothetical protein [Bacillus suaedaesalsae]|uniref:Uncharacterized protein n=1 Tax=Bacillus suaedaesalsae TaxID=2810349 RepID=A0ABS2DLC4_9BACI|nr:hypothetical protein [Bacillus suaedaesalsae]MBM6619300.1 hypothetical protein [Bacillus suaedaesalsae]
MKIESVIILVNKMCGESNYTRAREIIFREWDRLTDSNNYNLLNKSAKEFIKIIKSERETGSFNSLSLSEKKILNLFNQYVRELNLDFAKRIYNDNSHLFEKKASQDWLNSEAKIFYDAWKRYKNTESNTEPKRSSI